ncbi:hypothetical protein GCM10023187_09370 [Nibrella viscosa]|uniref:Uncharacterized protein n=1 Tax=Nibrella viscosa TaxID=1084524 RepID=A0ABP8K0U3_9BACT
MKRKILFIDDVYENHVPRFETQKLPEKVKTLKNVQIDFLSTLPPIVEINSKSGLTYEVPDFNNYDIIFVHASFDKPMIPRKVISDLLDDYEKKMYCFAGSYIPDKNGLGRRELYNNFLPFVKLIENFDYLEVSILRDGPSNYLEKIYQNLISQIDEIDDWKNYLSESWWSNLQFGLLLTTEELEELKVESNSFDYFPEFNDRMEEILNQAYRRLFL